MPLLLFFRSTVGLKILMASTGVILFGFVLAHMLGNLQIFAGPEQENAYGTFLHSQPELLWSVRVSSLFRSLGWMNSAYRPMELWFARIFATLIFVGMTSVPLSIQFGFVRLTPQF
jgi:hypothetical protein